MIACPKCRKVLPEAAADDRMLQPCPSCGAQVRVDLFNAYYQPVPQGEPGEAVQESGQAECFYHPGKKAVVPCDTCGRLLCSLCEVEIGGGHLCMGCLQAGSVRQKISRLKHKLIMYDSIALALAVLPAIITGPAAIYVALRYWKAPSTIVPRTRIRSIVAILLGSGQMVFWALFFIGIMA